MRFSFWHRGECWRAEHPERGANEPTRSLSASARKACGIALDNGSRGPPSRHVPGLRRNGSGRQPQLYSWGSQCVPTPSMRPVLQNVEDPRLVCRVR